MSMRSRALRHAPLLLMAAALMACGAIGPGATPSTIVLHEDAAGTTVHAHVGDTVKVELQESYPVPGSSLVWDVSSSAPSVLKPQRVTRDPAQRPAHGTVAYTADFAASGTGQATLFARGSQTCEAMANCPQKD